MENKVMNGEKEIGDSEERVTGRVLMDLLTHIRTIRDEHGNLLWKVYKDLCNDTLVNYIMGGSNVKYIPKDEIVDNIKKINEETVNSENFKRVLELIYSYNDDIKVGNIRNLQVNTQNISSKYKLTTCIMDRHIGESEEGGGTILIIGNPDGEMYSLLIIECFEEYDRSIRYVSLYHELAHAIFTKATDAYLDQRFSGISTNDKILIDEILTDIISYYINNGSDMKMGLQQFMSRAYVDEDMNNVAKRVKLEFMNIYNEEKL